MKKYFILISAFVTFLYTPINTVLADNTQSILETRLVPLRKIKNISLLLDSSSTAGFGKNIRIRFEGTTVVHSDFPYILFINGIPQKSMKVVYSNYLGTEMIFKLQRTKDDEDLLSNYYRISSPYQIVDIGVGTEYGMISDTKPFTLRLYNPNALIAGAVLIVVLLLLFLYLNYRWPLIRDESLIDQKFRPYSLARTQLAWWSLITLCSFIFLVCITGEFTTVSGSSVILLGISAATTAAGKIIDNTDKNIQHIRHQNHLTKGFFVDLLSDENGVSIHRFQSVAFHLAIGIYFLWEVIYHLKMPEIDPSLLTLMGVSSGAYTILKAGENKATTSPAPTPTGYIKTGEDDNEEGGEGAHTIPPPVG
ncbi:MAG TPA: hypothetical protein VFF27_02905 [Bacteroidia bacterium]|jgi:hypothetical protein|nr:hypothetical protein [Bacteroidia bacterium]